MKSPAVVKSLTRRKSYPWDVWTKDSKTRRFVKGEHFSLTPRQFAIMCHNHGRRHGFDVVTKVVDKSSVDVSFTKSESR